MTVGAVALILVRFDSDGCRKRHAAQVDPHYRMCRSLSGLLPAMRGGDARWQ
jgi:hypothetical protein